MSRSRAERPRVSRGWAWLVPAAAIAFAGCQNDRLPAEPEAESKLSASASAGVAGADDWIIVFKDGTQDPPGLARRLTAEHGGTVRYTYSYAIQGFAGRIPPQAIEGIRNNPNVSFVERDGPVQKTAVTWGLDRIDQRGLPLDGAFNPDGDGSGVDAYILDTGIDYGRQPAFSNRLDEGRDRDYVDDDFDASDCDGHGTHVAGTVGSDEFGVATGVTLISVRVLNCQGSGTWSGVIAGVDYVAGTASGPSVANMSLSGGTNSSLNAAVRSAVNMGIVFAVAAGNDNTDACSRSPASAPEAITVASSTSSDSRSFFSNYGSCVDLFAPGSGIVSTVMGSGSGTKSGTSMAAPHVAGAAALVLQDNPGWSASDVWTDMQERATNGAISNVSGSPNLLLYTGSGSGDPCANGCGKAMVKSISSVTVKSNRNRRASGTVTVEIVDETGGVLPGVVVTGDWTVIGASNTSSTGTTDSNGRATLSSGNIRNATDFSFCVSSLSKIGYSDESKGECDGYPDGGDPPPPGTDPMGTLEASSSQRGKNFRANLTWTGGGGTVEVWRGTTSGSMSVRATITNSYSYTDNLGKSPEASYVYKVCNPAPASDCSNEVPVFP